MVPHDEKIAMPSLGEVPTRRADTRTNEELVCVILAEREAGRGHSSECLEANATLYVRLFGQLAGRARKRGDAMNADDHAADVLYKFFWKILGQDGAFEVRGPGSVLAFLNQCVDSVVKSAIRHFGREEEYPDEDPCDDGQGALQPGEQFKPSIADPVSRFEARVVDNLDMEDRLPSLDPIKREMLYYAAIGFSYAEIAEMLGQTESSIKSAIYRARAHLRDH